MNRNILIISILIFITGCCTTKIVSPRQAFFMKNPELKKYYVRFDETSFDVIGEHIQDKCEGRLSLLRSVKENLNKYDDINEYFELVDKRISEDCEWQMDYIREIRKDFDHEKDSLFYYSYKNGDYLEDGWIVIRNGNIRKKYILGKTSNDVDEKDK